MVSMSTPTEGVAVVKAAGTAAAGEEDRRGEGCAAPPAPCFLLLLLPGAPTARTATTRGRPARVEARGRVAGVAALRRDACMVGVIGSGGAGEKRGQRKS